MRAGGSHFLFFEEYSVKRLKYAECCFFDFLRHFTRRYCNIIIKRQFFRFFKILNEGRTVTKITVNICQLTFV